MKFRIRVAHKNPGPSKEPWWENYDKRVTDPELLTWLASMREAGLLPVLRGRVAP